MRKFPKVANRPPVDVCMCVPACNFVCSLHRDGGPGMPAETIEEADGLSEECPWNPDNLPDRLKGFGYRGADQDGFNGSVWISPQRDLEETMIEAAKVLLDAGEI